MVFDFKERLIFHIPKDLKKYRPVWFHCASVGEFNTARVIIEDLKREGMKVIVTYFSQRAKPFMEKSVSGMVDWVGVLPMDLPFTVSRFNRLVNPRLLIVVEREFWPFLLLKTKAPKILINAYAKGSFMERKLISRFDHVIARTERDGEILREGGAKRVSVCGNLKLVFTTTEKLSDISLEGKIFVGGSTHEGEEKILLKIFAVLKKSFDNLRLVIAPRHISRSEEVLKLVEKCGFKVSLRSERKDDWDVLVVDTMGELPIFYKKAKVAFVGGTFVPIGGHNIGEPCRYDVPVIYGPYVSKIEDVASILEREGLGYRVSSVEEAIGIVSEILKGNIEFRKGFMKTLSEKIRACYKGVILEYI